MLHVVHQALQLQFVPNVGAKVKFVTCRFNFAGSKHSISQKVSDSGILTKLQIGTKSRKRQSNAIHLHG